METSWSEAEEKIIAQLMERDGLGPIDAIRPLRSSWLIGETAPPMSRPGRRIPRENPNSGTAREAQSAPVARPTGDRECPGCGSLFSPARPDTKTCSDRCRQRASRRSRAGAPEPTGNPAAPALENVTGLADGFGLTPANVTLSRGEQAGI
jgi:hypothetical protein